MHAYCRVTLSIPMPGRGGGSTNRCITTMSPNTTIGTSCLLEIFALSNRRFDKLSNDTKFVKIEVKLSEIQHLQSLYFLLFSLYFAPCPLSQNKLGRQDVPFVVLGQY